MKVFKIVLPIFALLFMIAACGIGLSPNAIDECQISAPQTDESLTVLCIGSGKDSQMIQLALKQYETLYPEVKVELMKPDLTTDGSDYDAQLDLYSQVATQIMAGNGPDVFIIDDTIMDVEKLVRQGVFADMEPFFAADNFEWTPYNQTVMDGGVWNGQRFTVPLSYDFPMLVTTQTALQETGFRVEACKDYMGFLEETTRIMEDSTKSRTLFRNPTTVAVGVAYFSGVPFADYDRKTVDLSSSSFRAGMQWFKLLMEKHPEGQFLDLDELSGAAAVRDGDALWIPSTMGALQSLYYDYSALKTVDEPVMTPIRDVNGGIQAAIKYPVAVRANSENLQNAYQFIKILLSSDIQCAYSGERLSVLDSANEYFYEQYSEGKWSIIPAGTQGFVSAENPYRAVDWPTRQEFEEFFGFCHEITGTYYFNHLMVYKSMRPYLYEGADYGETQKAAQRQMEIYISE